VVLLWRCRFQMRQKEALNRLAHLLALFVALQHPSLRLPAIRDLPSMVLHCTGNVAEDCLLEIAVERICPRYVPLRRRDILCQAFCLPCDLFGVRKSVWDRQVRKQSDEENARSTMGMNWVAEHPFPTIATRLFSTDITCKFVLVSDLEFVAAYRVRYHASTARNGTACP